MKYSKIEVKSPANIAFIKYWGQRDKQFILPYNDNFAMNLSHCYTNVSLEMQKSPTVQQLYIKDYKSDEFKLNTGSALEKVIKFYNVAKKHLKSEKDFGFIIRSENSFPKKAGIASSASFFSGLALAFATAFGEKLSEKELSILARLSGSGSACRSIPDGFTHWKKGTGSGDSYAVSMGSPDYWDLVDLVLIVTLEEKKTTSAHGHLDATTSPLYESRQNELRRRIPAIQKAFKNKDMTQFGQIIEEDTLSMHMVMMTQTPPLYYWSGKTLELMKKTVELRSQGIEAYYTIDAGENIHIICEKKDERAVYDYFIKQSEVQEIIVNYPCEGTRVTSNMGL